MIYYKMTSQDTMMIVVMVMMMSSVFSVIAGGGYFFTLPEEGDECKGTSVGGNYVIDEDGDCVLDYCDSGYTRSSGGCVVVVPDGDEYDGAGAGADDGADDDAGAGAGADDGADDGPSPTGWSGVSWSQIPGGIKQVDIDGNTVCGVNSSDQIYCKDDLTSGDWRQLPGSLKHVSVSSGKLYGVNSSDQIYYGE